MAGEVAAELPPPVDDNEVLWRYLRPDWIVPPDKGGPRVSSAAFKERNPSTPRGEVSVFRVALLTDELREQQARTWARAAEFRAVEARALGHAVEPDVTDNQHRSHAVVIPPVPPPSKPWEKNARKLAEQCTIVMLRGEG